jgi:hypothetical protein
MELATLIAGIAMLLVAAYCIVFNWYGRREPAAGHVRRTVTFP